MTRRTNRRDFLKQSALAGTGFWISTRNALGDSPSKSPNEKFNIACIGVGGKGESDSNEVALFGNVVAICDIDDKTLERRGQKFTQARKYCDYREMFAEMADEIDAVTISTPDHHHAAAAMMAMKHGKHVYCQKPLTHTVYEARLLRETARTLNLKTQMGNQGTSDNGFRRGVEIIRSGALGPVREVHVWTNRPIWPQAPDFMARPAGSAPIPSNVHWDLFLGPAPKRPYNPAYMPVKWRGWIDFGSGALGDMGCHTMNLAFMGLNLEYPTSVVAEAGDVNPETYPSWATVTYQFPARDAQAPVKLIWYEGHKHGQRNFPPQSLIEKVTSAHSSATESATAPAKHTKCAALSESGLILVADEGILYSPGDGGSDNHLFPEEKFRDFKDPPQTLPRNGGGDDKHKLEWLNAIRAGGNAQSMSHFGYAGLLSETVLLGNVAIRAGNGNPLELLWDVPAVSFTNDQAANRLLRVDYRDGWAL